MLFERRFSQPPSRAIEDLRLELSDFHTLYVLGMWVDTKDGIGLPSIRVLAGLLRLTSEDVVLRRLKRLIDFGYVERVKRGRKAAWRIVVDVPGVLLDEKTPDLHGRVSPSNTRPPRSGISDTPDLHGRVIMTTPDRGGRVSPRALKAFKQVTTTATTPATATTPPPPLRARGSRSGATAHVGQPDENGTAADRRQQLFLERFSSDERPHVQRALGALPNAAGLVATGLLILAGEMGYPREMPGDLARALVDAANTRQGDRLSPVSLARFVRTAREERTQLSGGGLVVRGRTPRAREALELWDLYKRGALIDPASPEAIDEGIARLASAGLIADVALFRAQLEHVKPWDFKIARTPEWAAERIAERLATFTPPPALGVVA